MASALTQSSGTGRSSRGIAVPVQAPPKIYRWDLTPAAPEVETSAIARKYGISPLVSRVLAARGWSAGEVLDDFLDPLLSKTHDPFLMLGMREAVDRLIRAVESREPLLVYGDYDVDGSTATALLVNLFRHLRVPVEWYVPCRLNEGYGLHTAPLEKFMKAFRLVVTVDTGITAVREADWARRNGLELIITDHHRPGDTLPHARALVNPNQPGCTYPNKNLAGVGVAFKLAHALLKGLGRDPEDARTFLRDQLDLVALGTICDLVPLVGENRAFVRYGLRVLHEGKRPGFRALKSICGFESEKPITTHNIGFGLGPRLNAAGRTANPRQAVDILVATDEAEAFHVAEELEKLNDERRKIERRIVDEVLEKIAIDCDVANDRVIVCAGTGWHLGVIGIVASRILDRFHRPTIICAIESGLAQGSGRSIEAFDLHSALGSCEAHLIQFGGHAHAAGVRLDANNIPALRRDINLLADAQLCAEDMIPKLYLDAVIEPGEVNEATVASLERLAPFGHKNKAPVFLMERMLVEGPPRIVGSNHLKLVVRRPGERPIETIGFGLGHHFPAVANAGPGTLIDLAGFPSINDFRGHRMVQFELRDLRMTQV